MLARLVANHRLAVIFLAVVPSAQLPDIGLRKYISKATEDAIAAK